jgi:Tfp pilus assembly protein PilF
VLVTVRRAARCQRHAQARHGRPSPALQRTTATGAASIALVALLLCHQVEAQTPQPVDVCPGEAGVQPSSKSSSDASGLALALTRRGLMHREAVRYDVALADFDAAIAVDPGCRLAWFARATTYWTLGDITRARLDFDRLIRFKRHDADLRIEEL